MAPGSLADTARRLIRRVRSAALATLLQGTGLQGEGLPAEGDMPASPFASLVTVAAAPDLAPLMWLSRLAQHSRNLARDPHCSVLLAGPSLDRNPQTAPRVTLIGTAVQSNDNALLARWHALNPYAAAYAGLADFSLWRLDIEAMHVVAGFAAAARLDPARVLPDHAVASLLAAAEPAILAHCNTERADAVEAVAAAAGAGGSGWRMVALDPDGFDLARGEELLRIDFPTPAQGPDEVPNALVRLARGANGGAD